MSDARDGRSDTRLWQRGLLLVLAFVALIHSAVLMFWLAPSGPVRDSIGERTLETYVNPYFGQSWSALAPNAQFVDESFRFRAHIENETTGKDRVTEWVDVTRADTSALRHSLDPARVHQMGRRLATNINGAMYGLDSKQRKLVKTNYISTPVSVLQGRLAAAGSPNAVRAYMAYDQMATRFASMYAKARFGGKILEVQYLVGRRTVPDVDDRSSKTVRDVEFSWFAFGYRRAFEATYEAQTAFDEYVGR
ncbi:DUF5819 family protein [Aeromicrobium sp. P5_D10]